MTNFRGTLKRVSAAVDPLMRSRPGVVILSYHQVGGPLAGEVNLLPDVFTEQMEILAATGAVVTLEAALELVSSDGAAQVRRGAGDRTVREPVVLTFDDGTADFAEIVVPILAKHDLPATLYLATEFVELGRSFWNDGTVLSWSALNDCVATGLIDMGSHTHTHLLLDIDDKRKICDDLDRSIDLIGEHLGVHPDHFAYPKAVQPSSIAEIEVRHRFRSAAIAGGRPNRYGDTDPWRLTRTPIQVSDAVRWFERKAAGGLRLEGALRQRVARRRYRKLSS